jgi:RNA polymerase sigma factor (sigma-70 family)
VSASPDRKEYLEDGEVKPQVFLSADEERDLARRYRQGDEKAGHRLARAYLPLVKRIAAKFFKKYANKLFDLWEDLVSVGWVGLMKAVRSYDPDRGARLGAYAIKWIVPELREFTKRQVPMKSLNAPVGKADGDETETAGVEEIDLLEDEGDDQEKMLADRQERERRRAFLKKALESLSDPERQIIVERHLQPQATPLKDLGARFGLSGESIRQMELKALKAMRGRAMKEAA